ncbi:hypothetical protein EYF80_013282 [Liparis tanakae]|uniref:Uncharacterized protein n=1 Tax=Liparis tanakae TaxID=230148 RepID=A0A4Z2IEZ3_9TELE|nr:hypothetical protein EYF80_013282 [Liparis tanakae]
MKDAPQCWYVSSSLERNSTASFIVMFTWLLTNWLCGRLGPPPPFTGYGGGCRGWAPTVGGGAQVTKRAVALLVLVVVLVVVPLVEGILWGGAERCGTGRCHIRSESLRLVLG